MQPFAHRIKGPSRALAAFALGLVVLCLAFVPVAASGQGVEEGQAGIEAQIELLQERGRSMPAILIGALLILIGAYHLLLYLLRRQAAEYLWFGWIASGCGIGTWLADGLEGYGLPLPQSLRYRFLAALIHLGLYLVLRLIWPAVPQASRAWVGRYKQSHLMIAGVTVLLPSAWIAATWWLRTLWCLPVIYLILNMLVSSSWRRRSDARLVWLGIAIVPLGFLLEVVLAQRAEVLYWPWAGSSFLVLAVATAVSVCNRFVETHRQLDRFRVELEGMVEDGTEELAETHRKLKSEVAERKVMEGALRMLERAVEQSIDGIAVTDLAGGTQFLNEAWARLHGWEVVDVLGYDLSFFHTSEQMQQEVYPLMAQVRETGAFQGEVWHRDKEGEIFPTWMSVTRVQDPDGQPVGLVAIVRDLRERREKARERLRLESKVLQAEKLESLAKLSAGIAHDFNNLLTVILGNTSLASRELQSDPTARARLQSIEAAAERAAGLSERLLASAGEDQKLHLRVVDLNALVEGMRSDLERRAPPGVELEFHLKDGLPEIDADPLQLRQVLLDLVLNALESIVDGRGVVSIRTGRFTASREYFEGSVFDEGQPAGDYLLFEVSDTGAGIDEQTRARLFDPFFSTKDEEGRGLGLSTSLGIVRAHRGAITIYSQVGRGTTFEILIPVAEPRPDEVAASDDLSGWRGHGLVMVVDDELLVREVSKDILESYTFEVVTASDGYEALELYHRHLGRVRAVVLDQTMPRLGGVETFRRMRELDPEALVLLMSGYGDNASRELVDEGLADFIHKPFRPGDLVLKLRELLAE